MLEYLQKFKALPAELRQKVSSPEAMVKIEALEKKYNFPLAALIMRLMVKEISPAGLADYLRQNNLASAEELARELKENILAPVKDYLLTPAAARPAAGPVQSGFEPRSKGASFYFSADDEAEIRELTRKIATREAEQPAELEQKLAAVTGGSGINFGSADLADRFKQIMKTYLRGIRNRLEAKATLIKPFLSGGLSFDAESAEKVMVLADKAASGQSLEAAVKPQAPVKPAPVKIPTKPALARDAAYDFSRLKRPTAAAPAAPPARLDTTHELAPLPPAAPAAKITIMAGKIPPPKDKTTAPAAVKSSPAAEPVENRAPLIRRRFQAENLSQSQKAKLTDVKYVPRVMGPLEELKFLDLVSFRRWGEDPAATAEKIRDKIELLAEENYAQKLAGVRMWRQSPLNRLYLEIGNKSISENKPVDVIIEERKAAGRECLTGQEFQAIMDLNKSLRF